MSRGLSDHQVNILGSIRLATDGRGPRPVTARWLAYICESRGGKRPMVESIRRSLRTLESQGMIEREHGYSRGAHPETWRLTDRFAHLYQQLGMREAAWKLRGDVSA